MGSWRNLRPLKTPGFLRPLNTSRGNVSSALSKYSNILLKRILCYNTINDCSFVPAIYKPLVVIASYRFYRVKQAILLPLYQVFEEFYGKQTYSNHESAIRMVDVTIPTLFTSNHIFFTNKCKREK